MRSVYEEIERNPTPRDRIELGLVFAVGMSVFGALYRFRWDSPGVATSLWIAAGVGFVLSLVPPIGRVLYVLWMGLGLTIGLVTSPILMFAVYAVVIVPVGLFLRLTRRDPLQRELDPAARSYWEDYPRAEDPARYLRQF